MSEQGSTGDRGEWQRTCEECGSAARGDDAATLPGSLGGDNGGA